MKGQFEIEWAWGEPWGGCFMVIKLSYSDVRNRRKLVRRDSQWRVAQK
jgi:hypothetical protein